MKPDSEMSFEFLSEMVISGQGKSRLRSCEYWNMLKQFSKKFQSYVNFSKSFISNISKGLREQMKKILNDLISFKTKVKILYGIDNLNQTVPNGTEVYYQYENLINKNSQFFEHDIFEFRRSNTKKIKP